MLNSNDLLIREKTSDSHAVASHSWSIEFFNIFNHYTNPPPANLVAGLADSSKILLM